ncbi:aldo/keto reductase [Aurantimonas endophytica]|uniref:Aryl-alcohol dehydrogenase-like predicted oxidoreductase n=1 Tax=Aurantimonas endophytica TaxID=1522175 RepID=A0A7W6MR65_9HYPH|nr:aldo/keto reductase [Aurantimonas endophytica]MBB4004785.1 aryl-alcohol dehydrogenase-like predicted oxidoreductase [Aurantimonas endophytica]MCO6405595.1 aldo/keto reductase [Aurantimonas endophytica]
MQNDPTTIDRRSFLGAAGMVAGAAAVGAAAGGTGSAYAQAGSAAQEAPASQSSEPAIIRRIGRTGRRVTALGLGTFLTFDLMPGDPRERLRAVVARYAAGGGGVIDTSPLYGSAEITIGAFLSEMAETRDIFVANKIWSTGAYLGDTSHATASLEQSRLRVWRPTIDLMQCHSMTNAGVVVPLLRAWKNEGHIAHVGVTHHESSYQAELTRFVERGEVDVVQTNYSIFDRSAEERLLPAAADQGVGVFVNLPLEKARLMHVVEGHPLPEFASEFEATSWAQFFLKWVIAHPAVTCVLCGTSDPDHMADNLQAMRGTLPDAAMRRRMVRHMETIPGFAAIGTMAWYPGKDALYQGQIKQAQGLARARLAG